LSEKTRKGRCNVAKPNVLVKISGNLLVNQDVLDWLRQLSGHYSLVVVPGGGGDINKAFKERGFEIKFCPLGRVTKSLEERQVARDVLEKNQALMQDLLDENGIEARVEIPVRTFGTVLCHENGDILVLSVYNGFDSIYILTSKNTVEAKRRWLEQLAVCFQHIEKGELNKIEVIGF
jgi:hypothetical protein